MLEAQAGARQLILGGSAEYSRILEKIGSGGQSAGFRQRSIASMRRSSSRMGFVT